MPQTRAAAPATIGDENDVPNGVGPPRAVPRRVGQQQVRPGRDDVHRLAGGAAAVVAAHREHVRGVRGPLHMAEPFPAAATTSAPDLISLSSASDAWRDGALGKVSETFTTSSCDVVLAMPAR